MYFSIRKTLSRLKSSPDSSSSEYDPPTWRRSSMSKIEELFSTACTFQEKTSSHTRASSDSGILSPKAATMDSTPKLFPILPPLSGALPPGSSQSKTDDLLQALLKENKLLRNENTYLKFEAQVREEELAQFRSEYYADKFNAAVRKHILDSTCQRCAASDPKPVPLKSLRPPPKLHRPVQSAVGNSDPRRRGTKVGATQPGAVVASSSKTIPMVSLARSNACLEAITSSSRTAQGDDNTAAKAQRVTKAHKPMEKVNQPAADLDRSGIDILGHGERTMNGLLKRLKTGSATLVPTTAARIRSPTAKSSPLSMSHTYVSAPVSYTRDPHRHLAPLASKVFKDEVKDSLSRVKRSSAKKFRSVLSEVDINRTNSRVGLCDTKQSIESGTSTKAFEKRKAILMEQPSLEAAIVASDESHFWTNNGMPLELESHHLPPLTPRTSTTCSSEDSGALSAGKALLSLERICAGFSSGSLGSLESTSDSSLMTDLLGDVSSLFVVDTTVRVNQLPSVSRTSSGLESPSFSRSSVKTSTPSVSRYRPSLLPSPFRPVATSSPKTTTHSTTRTPGTYTSPLRLTKATGAISSSPSSAKKTVRKFTSPLRIVKKV